MENQVYTDEINLFDYLKIIYKWKLLIVVLCIISVVATYIITSRPMPATYKVTALLSPGALSYTSDGKVIPIDSAPNIQSSIQNGVVNSKIIDALKLDQAQYSGLQFMAQLPKDSEVIRVSYDTPDPEKGKVIMRELVNQLSGYYKDRLILNRELNRDTITRQIDKLKSTLSLQQNKKERIQAQRYRAQNQKERLQNQKERKLNEKKSLLSDSQLMSNKSSLLTNSVKSLNALLKKADESINTLEIERNELLKRGDKTDAISLIFYSNTMQQAISYIHSLRTDLEKNNMEQETVKNELSKNAIRIKDIDTEMNDIDTQIKDIEVQIKDILTQEKDIDIENLGPLKEIENIAKFGTASPESIKILQEPTASINTVEKRTGKKVAAAGITALFIGIMLAFFIEYINKMQRAAG